MVGTALKHQLHDENIDRRELQLCLSSKNLRVLWQIFKRKYIYIAMLFQLLTAIRYTNIKKKVILLIF